MGLLSMLTGTGLLSILGIDKFTKTLGMDYKNPCYDCLAPGLSVVFVMDDTGSMGDEIKEATRQIVNIVNQVKLLGVNGPSNYVLSTFNDPGTTLSLYLSDANSLTHSFWTLSHLLTLSFSLSFFLSMIVSVSVSLTL